METPKKRPLTQIEAKLQRDIENLIDVNVEIIKSYRETIQKIVAHNQKPWWKRIKRIEL